MSNRKTIVKPAVTRRKSRIYTGNKSLTVNGSTLTVISK